MAGDDPWFCLKWNHHQTTLTSTFGELLDSEELFDCRIAAEGHVIRAHRILLSACSPYFKNLFRECTEGNIIILLRDVKFKELRALVEYMYKGEVNISQEELAELLKVAEHLKIKGLSDGAEEANEQPAQKRTAAPQPQPPQPIVPRSGTPTEHRPSNVHLLTSTDPRKRKRARRRISGDESGLGQMEAMERTGSTLTALSQTSAAIPGILATRETPLIYPHAISETVGLLIPKPEIVDLEMDQSDIYDPKTKFPMVLITRQGIDDMANANDDADLPMDDSQPGLSHGGEGATSQDFLFLEDVLNGDAHRHNDEQNSDDQDNTDDGFYHCSKCPKMFWDKLKLKLHRKHCGNEVSCPKCKKTFNFASTLKIHLNLGCDVVFKCEKCSKEFMYKGSYNRHMQTECNKVKIVAHRRNTTPIPRGTKKKLLKCDKCFKRFVYRGYYKRHVETNCKKLKLVDNQRKTTLQSHENKGVSEGPDNQHRETECSNVKIVDGQNSKATVSKVVKIVLNRETIPKLLEKKAVSERPDNQYREAECSNVKIVDGQNSKATVSKVEKIVHQQKTAKKNARKRSIV